MLLASIYVNTNNNFYVKTMKIQSNKKTKASYLSEYGYFGL